MPARQSDVTAKTIEGFEDFLFLTVTSVCLTGLHIVNIDMNISWRLLRKDGLTLETIELF